MRKCPNCNQEVKDEDRFCAKCGTRLNGDNEPVDFTEPAPSLNPDPAAGPKSMPDLPGSQQDGKTPPHLETSEAKIPPIPNDYIKLQEQSTENMKKGFKEGWKSLLYPAPEQKKEQMYRLLLLLFALITIIGLFMPFTTYGIIGVKIVRVALMGSVSGILILILKLLECGFIVLNRKNAVLVFDVLSAAVLGLKCLSEFIIRNIIQISQEAVMSQHMDPYLGRQMWNLHHPGSGFWVLVLAAIVSFVIALVYALKTNQKKKAAQPEALKPDAPKPHPEPVVPIQPDPKPAPAQPDSTPATPIVESQPEPAEPAAVLVEENKPGAKGKESAPLFTKPADQSDREPSATTKASIVPPNEDADKPAGPSAFNTQARDDENPKKSQSSEPVDSNPNESTL